jgi:hypothetical protein
MVPRFLGFFYSLVSLGSMIKAAHAVESLAPDYWTATIASVGEG